MTRYEADANRLAMQLAAMVIAPQATAMATDTHIVNAARHGVRLWCRHVLDDVSRPDHVQAERRPRLADLATHPVGALQILLSADPAPLQLRPHATSSDVASVNDQWAQLRRDVEVALHAWSTADPASRPKGERAWSPVADVAAVAQVAALLDWNMADLHGGKSARRVRRESAEISIAAQCVQRMATDGPLPAPRTLNPAPDRLQPIPVPTLGQLPAALKHLGRLVTTSPHLRPRTLAALIGQHIPVLTTLADALVASPPPGQREPRQRFAGELGVHSNKLSDVRIALRPLRSIEADDRRPTVQAQAITTLVTRTRDHPRWSDSDAQQVVFASLLPALAVTSAISKAAAASVQAGHWLEPAESEQLRWRKISTGHPISGTVSTATTHARELMAQLPPPRPSRSPFRSPHEVLTPQLRVTGRVRPSSPTVPAPTL